MGHDGVLESSTLLSVSRILQAHDHAHIPDPGRDHVPEARDGELVDENLKTSSSEKREQ